MPVSGNMKTDRLRRRSDFLRLQAAKKWVSPTVIVQAAPSTETTTRIGFTATKKLGGAVIRNRVKRRLRAAVRATAASITAPHDLVLIGRAETATCEYQALLKDLKWCLKKLEVTGHEKATDARP